MKTHDPRQTAPKDLLRELHALVDEAEKLVADSLTEQSTEAVEGLRARFGAAQERFSDLYDGAKQKVTQGARYTDATIRDYPYQSLAIAAGVGLLVGVILGRQTR